LDFATYLLDCVAKGSTIPHLPHVQGHAGLLHPFPEHPQPHLGLARKMYAIATKIMATPTAATTAFNGL
jgi:hypothetical protein